MPTKKLWPGAPGSLVEPPSAPEEKDVRDHPHVSINGRVYAWAPGDEASVPSEAVRIWQAYLEATR